MSEGFGPYKNEFKYVDPEFRVTDEVRKAYDKNGFIIIRNLMDGEEVENIKRGLEEYGLVEKHSYGLTWAGHEVPDLPNAKMQFQEI